MRAELRLSRALGVPHSRLAGHEPRTYTRTHPDGLTITTRDPEWTRDDVAMLLALADWEADRCPCGCGQQMTDCLIDAAVPPEQRPRWQAGFFECGAGLALAEAQAKQAKQDEAAEKARGRPVITSHRLWQVARADQPTPA